MTDRIDTDAIRDEALIADRPGQCDRLTALADGVDEEMVRLHAVIADRDRLLGHALDEVDRLRALADPAPAPAEHLPHCEQFSSQGTAEADCNCSAALAPPLAEREAALADPAPVGLTERVWEGEVLLDGERWRVVPHQTNYAVPPTDRYRLVPVSPPRRSRGGAVTVPVPLTDLLAKADDQADDLGIVIVYPEQVRALCEALRIAVDALTEMARGCRCGLCSDSVITNALAAVRELVDLGEKP